MATQGQRSRGAAEQRTGELQRVAEGQAHPGGMRLGMEPWPVNLPSLQAQETVDVAQCFQARKPMLPQIEREQEQRVRGPGRADGVPVDHHVTGPRPDTAFVQCPRGGIVELPV